MTKDEKELNYKKAIFEILQDSNKRLTELEWAFKQLLKELGYKIKRLD